MQPDLEVFQTPPKIPFLIHSPNMLSRFTVQRSPTTSKAGSHYIDLVVENYILKFSSGAVALSEVD